MPSLPSVPAGAIGPPQIGFGRDITAGQARTIEPARLVWSPVTGGTATALRITSSGAAAIRIALVVKSLPAGTELRFFSLDSDQRVFGPFTMEDIRSLATAPEAGEPNLFWSPVIPGDTAGLEVFVPSPGQVQDVAFTVPHLSHLVMAPDAQDATLKSIGDSGSCNRDLACYGAAWATVGTAVARYVFTKANDTFSCTGTLLADKDPRTTIPYFLTADHCVSTSSVAVTINTYWFFQRASCGAGGSIPYQQLTRGATLLAHDASVDYSFLRLNEAAPSSASFAGWSTTPPAPGAAIVGIHHPAADLKKMSLGSVDGIASFVYPATGTGNHLRVTWSVGVTEGGSSGSALFTGSTWPNQFVVGTLHGGYSSCTAPTSPDWYGRFDLAYPSLRQWLAPPGADLTVYRPGTGVWYSLTATSGWGAYTSSTWGIPGDQAVRGDFDGDGRADLVVWRPGSATWYILWSASNFNYANATSFQWGLPGDVPVGADFDGDGRTDLAVWRPSNGTWYVRFSGSSFNLTNAVSYQWGLPGDVPVPADFDGDGRTDLVVWRPTNGTWYVRFSSSGWSLGNATSYQWGLIGDVPLTTDFDGDGKTDLVVWRPADGTWYLRFSSSNFSYANWTSYQWGLPGDVPVQGDFDGDGRSDLVVWRPASGTWYLRYSTAAYGSAAAQSVQWGLPGDQPLDPK